MINLLVECILLIIPHAITERLAILYTDGSNFEVVCEEWELSTGEFEGELYDEIVTAKGITWFGFVLYYYIE